MNDKIFSVFVYNWQDNAYGPTADIDLPATEYELEDALQKVRDGEGGQTMLSVERFGDFRYLSGHIGEAENLRALNALAERLAALEPWQADAFEGLVRMDEKAGVEIDLPRLYDLASSVDSCQVLYEATDYASLGRFYAENDFVPELENVPEQAWGFLNFEAIGRWMTDQDKGAFLGDRGYVVRIGEIQEKFRELDFSPKEPDYTVLLEASVMDSGETVPLKLPRRREDIQDVLARLGADDLSDLTWRCADCRVPALRDAFSREDNIGCVNHAAKELRNLNRDELLAYKALVQAAGNPDLPDAMQLLYAAGTYIFTHAFARPEDVAKDDLCGMLCRSDAEALRPFVDLRRYGEKLMEERNISLTPYGTVERKGGEPVQTVCHEPEAGGMNMAM